jgi:5-methylcytosine-specific restriction protein A
VDAAAATTIAQRLEALFGLAFSGAVEEFEGGRFLSIRPLEPERPNGFSITVARTPARFEAMFRADSFSKGLVRQLSNAEVAMQESFCALRSGAETAGFRISLIINGEIIRPDQAFPAVEWKSFDLECDLISRERGADAEGVQRGLIETATTCMGLVLSLLPLEDLSALEKDAEGLPEGAQVTVHTNRYERSPVNRAACIAHYGFRCQVCGMDFESVYGSLGADFIEVHHLTPVSRLGEGYRINPIRDLLPVCCNCHSMLHKTDPPMLPDALRILLDSRHETR